MAGSSCWKEVWKFGNKLQREQNCVTQLVCNTFFLYIFLFKSFWGGLYNLKVYKLGLFLKDVIFIFDVVNVLTFMVFDWPVFIKLYLLKFA